MSANTSGLRVVTFNFLPQAYQTVARWAAQTGNQIVLVVTTPGPSTRPTPSYRQVVELAANDRHDILVTTRMRRIATPAIAALAPDLVISMTFPYRIPPEITRLPRYGAVNLHPAPLPKYRGPNPLRAFYEGWPTIGATLHRTAEEFDTGTILSKKEAPLPEDLTPEAVFAIWPGLMYGALAEGVARAIAGEPGEPQDETQATYAGQFTAEESWITWHEPMRRVQQRVTALNLFGTPGAKANIAGQPYRIQRADLLADATPRAEAGTVIEQTADGFIITVADGAVRVIATALSD